jgi:hypothetical protein
MEKELKKEVWKILKVLIFITFSIVVILPYLVQVTTYLHEKAHMNILTKYGVSNYYYADLQNTIPNFFNSNAEALGVTKFNFEQYQKLDKFQRVELHVSGIVSDLRTLFLISVYLSFVNVYVIYKVKIKKESNLSWVLAVNWILFMWLLALLQITIANITYPTGDVYQLIKFLRI